MSSSNQFHVWVIWVPSGSLHLLQAPLELGMDSPNLGGWFSWNLPKTSSVRSRWSLQSWNSSPSFSQEQGLSATASCRVLGIMDLMSLISEFCCGPKFKLNSEWFSDLQVKISIFFRPGFIIQAGISAESSVLLLFLFPLLSMEFPLNWHSLKSTFPLNQHSH